MAGHLPRVNVFLARFVTACLVAAIPAVAARAGDNPPSPATALNANADSDQGSDRRPTLAGDREGRWIAVWESDENLDGALGSDWDVLFSVSEDRGRGWSRPAPITLQAAADRGADHAPSIATDGDGTWVVVWQGADALSASLGPDADILWSRSTDVGRSWSRPTAIDSAASGDTGLDLAPRVAAAGRTWLVVWESSQDRGGAGKDFDILFSRSSDGGATWSRSAPLNSNAAEDVDTDRSPVLASDGRGRWLVVWESYDSLAGTTGRDWDLLYTVSEDDGRTWAPPRPANARARRDGSLTDFAPRLAADDRGKALLLWTSEVYSGANGRQTWELRARPFDFEKLQWGREEFVDASRVRQPALRGSGLARAEGRWVASWIFGRRGEGGDAGVAFAVRPDGGGWTEMAGPVPAVSCLERSDDDLFMTSDAVSGVWGACWSSQRRGGGPYGSDRDLFCTRQAR